MADLVDRPKAGKRKITTRNDFELCYIRHKYFRKANYNPTPEEMEPYLRIIKRFSVNTYFRYRNLFHIVGLKVEDLISIGRVHLVSFLGLFAVETTRVRYNKFVEAYKKKNGIEPKKRDFLDKNKANFTIFLKQRMEDVVRISKQKANNIKGIPVNKYIVLCGKLPQIHNDDFTLTNYKKLGYKKVTLSTFKSIKRKLKSKNRNKIFFDGNWYIKILLHQRVLTAQDLHNSNFSSVDNLSNLNPEQIYFNKQEEIYWQEKQVSFDKKSISDKIDILKDFVSKNKGNPDFREELRLARKKIRELGG